MCFSLIKKKRKICLKCSWTLFLLTLFSKIPLAGITTLVGGGTGPADGTRATTCTPAPLHLKFMLQSTDDLPLNFGFTGKVCLIVHAILNFFVVIVPLPTHIYRTD